MSYNEEMGVRKCFVNKDEMKNDVCTVFLATATRKEFFVIFLAISCGGYEKLSVMML